MGILTVMIIALVVVSGCGSQPTGNTTEQNATPAVTNPNTTMPKVTATPTQRYKTVTIIIKPETKPATAAFGFTMDYPSEWTYIRERSSDWSAVFNFSNPDDESQVHVNIANEAGSATHMEPLTMWATQTIADITQPYCHDGAGNRIACSPTEPGNAYHHLVVVSNDPARISGSNEARKLVFTAVDDEAYGIKTIYLMYAGKIKGFNYTVPYHYETAVKVNGSAWDYGMGGMRYKMTFYTPADQVNATQDLFRHMINSFKITK
jgi:hypothetical protein